MGKKSENRVLKALGSMMMPLLVLAVLLAFFTGLSNIQNGSGEEGKRQLEESVRRAAAACYASEGIYPPTLDYMKEKYGLQINESKYYVDYKVFASNLMPDFTVLEIDGEGYAEEDGSEE